MIELSILDGKLAGNEFVVRRFPLSIGRGAESDLRLEEAGVFDQHFSIDWDSKKGFLLTSHSEAPVSINDQAAGSARLKNGDLISFGAVKIRFWLSAVKQKNFIYREVLTWVGLGGLLIFQIALIYWLGV